MTKHEDLIEYILLEYISNLDFISGRLAAVGSKGDLDKIGHHIIPEAILSFGYMTRLKYEKISLEIWRKLLGPKIFAVTVDNLFGEKVNFDIDLYRKTASEIRNVSKSHSLIRKLIDDFGQSGFEKAIMHVAAEHKWEIIAPRSIENSEDVQIENRKISSLSQKEIIEIVEEISKIKVYVDDLALSQEDKSQVHALATAAQALAESPNPPWRLIKEIVYLIAAISTSLGFVLAIASKIH